MVVLLSLWEMGYCHGEWWVGICVNFWLILIWRPKGRLNTVIKESYSFLHPVTSAVLEMLALASDTFVSKQVPLLSSCFVCWQSHEAVWCQISPAGFFSVLHASGVTVIQHLMRCDHCPWCERQVCLTCIFYLHCSYTTWVWGKCFRVSFWCVSSIRLLQ